MTKCVIIVSADSISTDDFLEFLKQEDAFNPDDAICPGRVSDGSKHIWIGLACEPVSNMTEGLEDEFARALVRPAKTAIVIEISRKPGSVRLAIDFAIKIMTRWHAVLSDYNDALLSLDDLRIMQRDGREFDPSKFTPLNWDT